MLNVIIKQIIERIRNKEQIKEKTRQDMRRVTKLSKHAIIRVHNEDLEGAKSLIEEARKIISLLADVARNHPDLIYNNLFRAANQEFAEATIFLKLIEKDEWSTLEESEVSPKDYILGIADVIGEFRRVTLDSLRRGNIERGEKCLRVMEEIYISLISIDEAYLLVSNLRRKCDVARKLIEITRGDVTLEVRRNALEKKLSKIEGILKSD